MRLRHQQRHSCQTDLVWNHWCITWCGVRCWRIVIKRQNPQVNSLKKSRKSMETLTLQLNSLTSPKAVENPRHPFIDWGRTAKFLLTPNPRLYMCPLNLLCSPVLIVLGSATFLRHLYPSLQPPNLKSPQNTSPMTRNAVYPRTWICLECKKKLLREKKIKRRYGSLTICETYTASLGQLGDTTTGGIQLVRTGSIEPSQGILLEQRTG